MSPAALLLAAAGTLLVLPAELQDEGARAEPWLAPASAELLAEALRERGAEVVEPADAALAAARLELPQGAPSRAATLRLAELLDAAEALSLRASLRGETLTLGARRLSLPGVLGSPVAVSGELDDLGRVVSVLAERLLGGEADDAPGGSLAGLGPAALDWARGLGGEDLEERRASLERAVAAAPHHDGPRLALGVLLREQGEPAAAAAALAPIRDPLRTRRAALLRALALLEAGEHEAARELFASLARVRETPAVLNGLAVALLRQERSSVPEPVFAALERAARLAPGSPVLAFNRAWAELRAGRADQAAARLGDLIAREPRDALARLVRVWCLGLAGQGRARDAEWEALLELAPGLGAFPEPDVSRPLERLIESEHGVAAAGDPRRPAERAADALGRAERLLAAGALEPAWREASRALYLDPERPRAHLVLARTLRARGEHAAALRTLRVALWAREDAALRRELELYLEEVGDEGGESPPGAPRSR